MERTLKVAIDGKELVLNQEELIYLSAKEEEKLTKKYKQITRVFFAKRFLMQKTIDAVNLFMSNLKNPDFIFSINSSAHIGQMYLIKGKKDILGICIAEPTFHAFQKFFGSSMVLAEVCIDLNKLSKEELLSLKTGLKNVLAKETNKTQIKMCNSTLKKIIKLYKKQLGAAAELADIFGDVEV